MLALFLGAGRRGEATGPAPSAEARRSPRLKLAGIVTVLLTCAGIGAFVYAAGTGARRGAGAGTTEIAVAITDKACEPATLTVPAGRLSFVVTNRGERVLEWEILDGVMVLEERENIAPGQSRRLTTKLDPGEYAITCGLLSAPRGRLVVQASTAQPHPALTLMDMVGPAAEYRAFLSERGAALAATLDVLEQAGRAGDAPAADKARRKAVALLAGLRPATAGDAELATLFGRMQTALAGEADIAPAGLGEAAGAFSAALDRRTILPDTMLAGAIGLLSPAASPEDIAAASGIARLLLPLTARIDPDLAARTRAALAALPKEAPPGEALRPLADDLSAMRKALALPETERRS
ncbi:cupredoxin domain-containing protein [Bosea sp. (in: a-proteobacteria)]|uniref:cupredoxin domain-containing protein n=1 Tax=Bosea sp. (in: a-proteobacteria) TaxID=1871050 RepID=UPI002627450E|nr:cupredoxin domain-containing protein [Bosea sp. (in: a-proteobacteria)]MCO5090201.1 cupredoxin domain-containing protein [Bosea sp. (in: a-proteobacteria)]